MKNKLFISSILLFLAAMIQITAWAQVNEPVMYIPSAGSIPVADGKITEPVWQQAAELTEFINWSRDSYIKDSVKVLVCSDAKNLYVAFRNSDPGAARLMKSVSPKGPRDTFLWGRNHVSVGLSYGGKSIRLMADPKGTMTDWKGDDLSWNGNWQYGASINSHDWSAEFIIPLSDLSESGIAPGEEIKISISRSFPMGESSEWSGRCVLSAKENLKCTFGRWPEPVPGKNFLPFSASNFGNAEADIKCVIKLYKLDKKPVFINQTGQGASSEMQLVISSEPLIYNYEYSLPARQSVEQKLQFDLPYEGSYFASASVLSAQGSIIRRGVDFWFTIEPNRQKLNSLKGLIGESIASLTRLSGPVVDDLKKKAESYYSDVLKLESSAENAWSSARWNELTDKTDKLKSDISRHLNCLRWNTLMNWNDTWDFGISLTHSVVKLKKDEYFPFPVTDRINISLAGNEYESFQLALLPFSGDMKNMHVRVSDLKSKDGSLIGNKNIEVSLVDYNMIEWQADYVAEKGWHPDPLIPFRNGMTIDGSDLCRPLWITVYAPAGTKPGNYQGTIEISADGMKKVIAFVECRVWGFDLPVTSHLKTHSWDNIEYMADFYNLEEYPVEWYMNFCQLLLKNRFNPGSAGINYVSEKPVRKGKYDFSRVEKVLQFCIDRGLSRFSMIQMRKGLYTPKEEAEVYKFIEAYSRFLKERGWLDEALVELWDEPTDLEWPYIRERAEKIKKIDKDIRLQLFAEGGPYEFSDRSTDKYGLNDLVNIWAPVNIIESPETQAKGGEIWTYFCTLARESAPNFFIDCPAIYQRSIPWYCWMYGVDGFEHWSTNYFWRNVKRGEPVDNKWPNTPWDSRTYYYYNGEGQLVYPGPEGATYSSIRLENFRDGMEDYEYLFRLRELLSAAGNEIDDPMLNSYRQLLKPEDYLLIKNPRKIKVTLENTLRFPDQPELILERRNMIANAIEKLLKK
ncbi:MAG TPA: DUF6067 family protein [Bacteroidales bacterium]|nr:DUF4091 domain-containing protein [Bacteroidales bacterium]HNR40606.1 DUF6067 family protein [Bacteroidales bacterium]HPM18304.1 DUF6067 family protein [Bacteroidales bacterium]